MREYTCHKSWVILALIVHCTFSAKAQCDACQFEVDLVTNGDFENGNFGFTTALEYSPGPIFFCPLCDENTYAIGANATLYHSGFSGSDHTNPPSGDFLIANGPGQAGALVWCQTTPVQPNTDYSFTFWARDVTNNNNPHPTALLQASFNNIIISDTLNADGGWEEMTLIWNSGSLTSVEICIINQQSLTGGNDFGLDDISLTGCHNYQLSQNAIAGEDITICSNEQINIGTNPILGYQYNWDNLNGLNSANIGNPQLVLANTTSNAFSETYIVTRDSAGVGCIDRDTIVVTVLPLPAFELGPDLIVCPGEEVTLDAGESWESVQWSTGASNASIAVTAGTYDATVSIGICSASDAITVAEVVLPEIDLGDDQEICSTTTLVLDAGVTGLWSDGSVSDTLQVNEAGDYSFTFTESGCTIADEVSIAVVESPAVNLPSDTTFCQGTNIELNAGVNGLWSTGAIGSSILVSTPAYYDIVVTNGPCITQAGTQVEMFALPVVNLEEYAGICEEDSLHLIAFAESNDSYLWSTGDTLPDIFVRESGNYEVIVSNECGSAQDEILLETYPCAWNLFIPSSFTPNEDGFNESWQVYGYNVSNVRIIIYNRFGDAIFKTDGLESPWTPSTGVYDDVYNYRVEATAFDGEQIVQMGQLYLLR